MGLDEFFSPRVLIVVGKGGVGKTTTTAALGLLAASAGRKVLIVEVEGKDVLPRMLGARPLGYREQQVAKDVWARTISPEEALVDYFEDHNMGRLSRRLARSNVIDYVATAVPGLKDIIVLGKVKAIANDGGFDTVLVDSPAAGHAVVFLTGARGIVDAVRVGPIRQQALEVLSLLEDHDRTRVQLVTLPEETPVNETVETRSRITERVDVALGPVIVNAWIEAGVEPAPSPTAVEHLAGAGGTSIDSPTAAALAGAARFRAGRRHLQEVQMRRLADAIDLPLLRLPFCVAPDFGPGELAELAHALEEQLTATPAPA